MSEMIRKACLQIGNFGGELNQIDGQTIKTVMFGRLLDSMYDKNIKIDIYNYSTLQYILLYAAIPFYMFKVESVYIGLGKRGMMMFAPWLVIINFCFKRKIIYYVIGGWLFDFINSRRVLCFLFKRFYAILVELPSMIIVGKALGFSNVNFFPNFRICDNFPTINKTQKNKLKLLFYSRVIKEKGIKDALAVIDLLTTNNCNVSLGIYGPLLDAHLLDEINNNSNAKYHGVLDPLDRSIYYKIAQYDILLFPTFYMGEGFPGAIVDAFISGVPVLATDWKYNSEIIMDGRNGGLFPPKNIHVLYRRIMFYYNNPLLLDEQKENAQIDAKKYTFDSAQEILQSLIDR